MGVFVPIVVRLEGDEAVNQGFSKMESSAKKIGGVALGFDLRQLQNQFSQINNLTKEQQRMLEVGFRGQTKIAEQAARENVKIKESELRQFENVEKSKQRIAEISAKAQVKENELAVRESINQKRREFAEYQRIEREKARLAKENQTNLATSFAGADLAVRAIMTVKDAVTESVQEFRNFGKEIANLDTLLDDNSIKKFEADILSLNPNLGKSSELARGMYQAISSGVEAKESLDFITISAKAARAGLATTFETVDAGTSVMASFGLKGAEVADVYGKMFEVVKRGKVEMPTLASSIGMVTNIASQTGVKLDEMFAAIATSSRTVRATQAIEGFRSALSNILKPSKEASDLAQELGIDFSVAGLKSKGFAQFLDEVTKATKGNQDQLATLFGDVQALGFIMSITGNQAKQMADDLKGVEKANVQVVLDAFNKQLKSLDSQIVTFKNTVTQGLIITFKLVEPILTFVLATINKYPVAFTVAAVAIGVFFAALNAGTLVTFGSQVLGLISHITLLGKVMVGTASLMAGANATMVAATAGWGTLLLVVGAVGYALYNYAQAQQKTTQEQLDSIKALNAQITGLNEQKATLVGLQGNVENLAGSQQTLAEIYNSLDSASRNRVSNATEEKGVVGALAEEVERLNKAKGLELDAKLTQLAQNTLKAFNAQEIAIRNATFAEKEYQDATTNGRKDIEILVGDGAKVTQTAAQQMDILMKNQIAAGEASAKTKAEFEGYKTVLNQAIPLTGKSTIEFLNQKVVLNQLEGANQEFKNALSGTSTAQNTLTNNVDTGTDALNRQGDAVDSLTNKLKKLMGASQARIDDRVAFIAMTAKDTAEAKAMMRRSMQPDDVLYQDFQNTKRWQENEKAARELTETEKRTRPARTKYANPKAEFSRENRVISGNAQWDKWVYQYADQFNIDPKLIFAQMMQESSFKKNAVSNKGAGGLMQIMPDTFPVIQSAARKQKIQIGSDRFDPQTNIKAGVFYLRQQLNTFDGDTGLALAAYNAGPGAVQKYGNTIPPYKETRNYVKRISDRYQKLKGGKFEAGSNFDYERSLVEQSDRLTREALDKQTMSVIELARQRGIRPEDDVLRGYNRMQVEDAKKAGLAQPTIEQTQAEFASFRERESIEIKMVEQQKTYTELRREQLNLDDREGEYLSRKLNANAEAIVLLEDYNLGLKEQLQDAEREFTVLQNRDKYKEAQLVYQEQINQQTKEMFDVERDLLVLRSQADNDQFIQNRRLLASKREEYDLQKEITDLQDRLANGGINDSLRVQKAHLEDILELRSRELNAVISINRSQLELANKGVFSQNQADAQLYDYINQNFKSVTQSYVDFRTTIADGFLQQIDSPFERLNQSLEKLPPIIKGVASAFVNLANDIVRAFSQKLISQVLGGGQQNQSGGFSIGNLFGGLLSKSGNGVPSMAGVGGGGFSIPTFNGSTLNFPMNNFAGGGGTGGMNQFAGSVSGFGGFGSGSSGFGADSSPINAGISSATAQLSSYSQVKSLLAGKANLLGSVGSMLPLLGLGLGASLGGDSTGGQILGGLGGLAGGLAGYSLLAPTSFLGVFGTAAPLLATASLVAAPLLILGALLLKRNAARRRDETTRDALMVDTLSRLRDIKAEMEAARPGINVQGLLEEAKGISSNYFTQANTLKDKKTRNIAIKDGRERVGIFPLEAQYSSALLNQIYAASSGAEMKEQIRNAAQNRDRVILPEFHSGVFMDSGFASQYGEFKRRNGMLQGSFTGRDTLPSMLAMGEMVLNPMQIKAIQQRAGFDVFAGMVPNYQPKAEMPKFAEGVSLGSASFTTSSPKINVENKFEFIFENVEPRDDAKIYLKTPEGKKLIWSISSEGHANDQIKTKRR